MEASHSRKITRNRELRSCTECRTRKLRCDRHQPCSACARRNEEAFCIYERNLGGLSSERSRRVQAEAKLEHLELLVHDLQSQQNLSTLNGTTVANSTLDSGDIYDDSLYHGATHWSAMLEDIDELRAVVEDLDEDQVDPAPESHADDGASLLFGAANSLSFQQVLSQFLPPRQETDRLVAAYFRARAVAATFIHTTQFSRLYQAFWEDPSAVSVLWTSILFSILDIARRTLLPRSASGVGNGFAMAAAHCLSIGAYHKPQRFTVEALLLYAQARCITNVDIPPVVGILFAPLVRLAITMGYHREPSSSAVRLSAFEGEMRRRTWSLCLQLDVLVSFQLGLPTNIQLSTWDTREPTNLLDSEFDEGIVELPSPRPVTQQTELVFYIAKHRLMGVFQKIIRHTLSVTEMPDQLEMIDQEVRSIYGALPKEYRVRSMTNSVVDPPSVVVTRLCLYFIYQKSLCVLHRCCVMQGKLNSIQACYDAASGLVSRFLDIYKEFEPGGQLESERWFMGSITWHDFLLGCMALCLTVCSTRALATAPTGTAIVDVGWSLELLRGAQVGLKAQSLQSRSTRKAQRLIKVTVSRFSDDDVNGNPRHSLTNGGEATNADGPLFQDDADWWSRVMGMDDPELAFMEQFLDFSNQDIIDAGQASDGVSDLNGRVGGMVT